MKQIKKKGQMFTIDLLFGFILFVIVFLILEGAWVSIREKSMNQDNINDLQLLSDSLAQNLLSSSGNPQGWEDIEINSSSVKAIGIATSPNLLSVDKIMTIQSQNNEIYDELKEIFGITGPGYEFYVEIRYLGGGGLFGLNPVIAYTFANSDSYAEEGNAEYYGIRDYLDSNEIEYTNYMEDWQTLLENIDDYNVAIFEDPDIDDKDLTKAQQNKLKAWLERGNFFLHKEKGTIGQVFGLNYNSYADNMYGIVKRTDNMLNNVGIGDEVFCEEGYRINKNKGNVGSLIEDNSNHPMIAYANVSNGTFFYLCDTQGKVFFNTSRIEKYNNVREIINFGGGVLSYKFGIKPIDYDIVSRTQRIVTLDTNTTANMIVMVWKRK
ncbi:MAG TPA: hypothetical protein PLX15_03445 [Candidatus Woesearchaeota archaeon]|nr:hypothetical protein [Candidatus Woesearchaeota archaeon]